MNSISRYVGSGQRSSATIASSASACLRTSSQRRDDVVPRVLGVIQEAPLGVVVHRVLELLGRVLERLDRLGQASSSSAVCRAGSFTPAPARRWSGPATCAW